jgi:hypothetical protein
MDMVTPIALVLAVGSWLTFPGGFVADVLVVMRGGSHGVSPGLD